MVFDYREYDDLVPVCFLSTQRFQTLWGRCCSAFQLGNYIKYFISASEPSVVSAFAVFSFALTVTVLKNRQTDDEVTPATTVKYISGASVG